jgi:hypothetical protein
MSTVTGHPVSYDSNYSAYSVSGLSQGETDSSSTNYATINLTRGSRAETVIFYNFDLDIPEGVTINSVSCTAKCYISSTNSSRIATRQVQLYSGNTAKGSAATVSNSTSVFNVTAGNWTASELNNAKIRIYAQRGTSNTSTNYYYRFYGATITVEYTEASSGNKVFIKKNKFTIKIINCELQSTGGESATIFCHDGENAVDQKLIIKDCVIESANSKAIECGIAYGNSYQVTLINNTIDTTNTENSFIKAASVTLSPKCHGNNVASMNV